DDLPLFVRLLRVAGEQHDLVLAAVLDGWLRDVFGDGLERDARRPFLERHGRIVVCGWTRWGGRCRVAEATTERHTGQVREEEIGLSARSCRITERSLHAHLVRADAGRSRCHGIARRGRDRGESRGW